MKKFSAKVSQNYQLKLQASRVLDKNTFNTYETSWETEYLQSESNRIIYGELIAWKGEESDINAFDAVTKEIIQVDDKSAINDDDEEEEQEVKALEGDGTKWWTKFEVKPHRTETLKELALACYAKGFNKGNVDDRITCQDKIDFGMQANIELPFKDLLELDNEDFWKRKVERELSNAFEFEKLRRSLKKSWKQNSVEIGFGSFVEDLRQNNFHYDVDKNEIIEFTKKLENFVEKLKIHKLKIKKFNEGKFKVVNFSPQDCEHVSLEFLEHLKNLKTLSIEFNSGALKLNYKRRFFDCSIEDIQNLSAAIVKLKKLERIEITNSNLSEHEKIQKLLKSLEDLKNLKFLNLTNCSINSSESGESFAKFLEQNESIEYLELRDNKFDYGFCVNFANGILNSRKTLKFLGLSLNPIFLNGLSQILNAIRKSDNIFHLNISGCENEGNSSETYENFTDDFCKLLMSTQNLKFLDISNIFIPHENLRQKIIEAFNSNTSLIHYNFNPSDFPCIEREAFLLEIINRRNKFYYENPILRKDTFTEADEIECIKWLRRVKHPSLLKSKRKFEPSEVKVKHENQSKDKISSKDYENFLFTFHPGLK